MPQFFSNVRTGAGELIADLEGEEFNDLDECRAKSLETAADLIANARGLDWRRCAFEVTDEIGKTVLVVRFSEAPQPRAL